MEVKVAAGKNKFIKSKVKFGRKFRKPTLYVLNYLDINEQATGYEIMKRQGMASGVLYPILKRELKNENLTLNTIFCKERNRERHVYSLTEKGRESLFARHNIE